MGGDPKKTKKELRETRKAQNARYRERKAAAGLVMVSVWVPAEALEKAGDVQKIGIVVGDAKEAANGQIVVKKRGKKFEVIERQGQLLE